MSPFDNVPVPPTVADTLGYFSAEQASFHMPGHKQRGGYHPLAPQVFGEAALRNDVSEMGGFDYLHAPTGSLVRAQEISAQIFGARRTYFLVNGSTVGNLAAILSHAGDDSIVAAIRGSHRSVYSAIALSGAEPLWIPMTYATSHQNWFTPSIPAALPERTSVVHITRPNYYGMAVDMAPYRALADSVGAVLIVDEAHGTHFGSDPRLPASALQLGADIVIQSTHKTLSALTQASMLHVGADPAGRVQSGKLSQTLAMLQSSSPSALLSMSLDLAAHEHVRDEFASMRRVVDLALQIRAELASRLTHCSLLTSIAGAALDPTKLVIDLLAIGMSGFAARDWLRAEHGVGVELADDRFIVCSLTVGDDEATASMLTNALCSLDEQSSSGSTRSVPITLADPQLAMTPRAAVQGGAVVVPLGSALNRVCAEYVIPYPPGIPVLAPGELVTTAALTSIEQFQQAGAKIVGPADPTLRTLTVVT